MPIQPLWDNEEKTVIRSESSGQWTWEEYHETLNRIIEMMGTVNQRVDLIHVRLPDATRPVGSGMPHYQRAMRILPENIGLHIVVNPNPFARAIVSIFLKLYGSNARGQITLAASLDDARAMIAKDRVKRQAA